MGESERGKVRPVLALRNVHKAFDRTVALDDARLELFAGEVTGLIGENGAGKSTIVKIISGLIRPDSGDVLLDDQPVRLNSIRDAQRLGIRTVFQELSSVPDLTVAENLLLSVSTEQRPFRRKQSDAKAREIAAEWGLGQLDTSATIASLSMRDRQLLEVLSAVSARPRIIVLDEPTSSLAPEDRMWLHSVVQKLRARGTAILFISHMFDEVELFCDRATVQRNGRHVESMSMEQFDRAQVIEQMIGRSLGTTFPAVSVLPPSKLPAFELRDIGVDSAISGLSLSIAPGEVLGVAGLEGQGQLELFEAVAGARPKSDGQVRLDGKVVHYRSPHQALSLGGRTGEGGIAFVPPDRKTQGLVLDMTVRKNVALPILSDVSAAGVIRERREAERVAGLLSDVGCDPARLNTAVRMLSGGNQQKVSLARALASSPRVLVLYDPTRGVDVGTKVEIYKLIHAVAARGTAVLFYSTEIPELANLCHRVVVMYAGKVVADLSASSLDEQSLMAAAVGIAAAGEGNGGDQ